MHGKPYLRLLIMAVLAFAAMYALMYARVNVFANAIPNLNMAGLMAAPMVVIELLLMRSMYPNRRWNFAILVSIVALLASWVRIRQQVAITDREFLKSMIAHHAGAILMCEKAEPKGPEIRKLCAGINASEQAEIEQMKGLLQGGG